MSYISPRQQKAIDANQEEAENPFTTMTKVELTAWIDTNFSDPETKTALKFMARAIRILWQAQIDELKDGG